MNIELENIQREINELREYIYTNVRHMQIVDMSISACKDPEKVRDFMAKLSEGADVMAEVKGKVDQMDKRIDSNERWMRFSYKVLWGLIAIIAGCAIKITFWGIPK